jgi:5-methylcytosine-specific restriction endonuclease McrA
LARAVKSCRIPDCPHVRPCPEPGHEPKAWEGSNRRKRLPPGWEKTRCRILLRDPICSICHDALSTVCDHKVAGDDHSDENLQGICGDCDKRKSSREGLGQAALRAR